MPAATTSADSAAAPEDPSRKHKHKHKHKTKDRSHDKDKDSDAERKHKRKRHAASPLTSTAAAASPVKRSRLAVPPSNPPKPSTAATAATAASSSSSALAITAAPPTATPAVLTGTAATDAAALAANTPFQCITTELHLMLAPKYSYFPEKTYAHLLSASSEREAHLRSLTPLNGVQRHHLDPLLGKYFEPVGGVVVAYRNIRFGNHGYARIAAESPWARIPVTIDFLIWRPRCGMVLVGRVNLQSASHIGLLVENMWNVSIPRDKIPDSWKYHETREGFVSKDPVVMAQVAGYGDAAGEKEGEGGEREQEEEVGEMDPAELGGWITDTGEYVDGMLRFQVDSIAGGGSIFVMRGSLLNRAAIERAEVESAAVAATAATAAKIPTKTPKKKKKDKTR